jgi:hypothetical protein
VNFVNSYKEPVGPDVNTDLWTMHVTADKTRFWYNPYTKMKIFKSPYAELGYRNFSRPTDVYDEYSDDELHWPIVFSRSADGSLESSEKETQ